MRERDARSTALKNADTIFQKRHLEVSTAAAHGADALVGSVASVRGGEPKRVAMSQLQHEELCEKRQSRGKDGGREGEAGEMTWCWQRGGQARIYASCGERACDHQWRDACGDQSE